MIPKQAIKFAQTGKREDLIPPIEAADCNVSPCRPKYVEHLRTQEIVARVEYVAQTFLPEECCGEERLFHKLELVKSLHHVIYGEACEELRRICCETALSLSARRRIYDLIERMEGR